MGKLGIAQAVLTGEKSGQSNLSAVLSVVLLRCNGPFWAKSSAMCSNKQGLLKKERQVWSNWLHLHPHFGMNNFRFESLLYKNRNIAFFI
jgi:hypothetical protein